MQALLSVQPQTLQERSGDTLGGHGREGSLECVPSEGEGTRGHTRLAGAPRGVGDTLGDTLGTRSVGCSERGVEVVILGLPVVGVGVVESGVAGAGHGGDEALPDEEVEGCA